MKEDEVFKEESEFFCSVCGKELKKEYEIDEEICKICLKSLLDKSEEIDDKKRI